MDLEALINDDELLPEEIQAELARRRAVRDARQATIAGVIRRKRDEAVKARRASGIEREWAHCEEQYQGIDDANRNDIRALKAASPDGTVVSSDTPAPVRSTAFLNITRPYTDAAASRISDMLLPTDDRNWALRPTPLPELSKKLTDLTPIPGQMTSAPLPIPEGQALPAGGQPAGPAPRPMTVADMAQQLIEKANDQAKAAEKRIDDWLTQSQYHCSIRQIILDCARLGTGALKGPVPVRRKAKKVLTERDGSVVVERVSSIDPETKHVSPWNCYPDPACGSSIHNGSYFVERDDIGGRKLRELREIPGYSAEKIDAILLEGPARKNVDTESRAPTTDLEQTHLDEMFEVWYFYGDLDRHDFELMNVKGDDVDALFRDELFAPCGKAVPVLVTMVNDTPIKVARNPLDSGEFPYDFVVWQERANSPYGYGVPYQIRTPQEMANAATRNMMDNAGLAGGPILVVDQNLIEPSDGSWVLTPRKIFTTLEAAVGRDVRNAITAIDVPMLQGELLNIINFALKMAEDVTGLPMLLQGQLGKAPDTVGGMQMLQNNASSVSRRLAKLFDDRITEPHIGRYYEWLLLYGPKDEEKGDFHIDARGSSALVERDIQNQTIGGMLQLSLNPVFELSPARCMEEFLKSQKLDVARFKPTDAEKQAKAQQQPAPPPQVMAAQIREQGAMQRAELDAQVDMARIQSDRDRDTAFVQAETQRTQVEHVARMQELRLKLQLAQLEYANANQVTLAQIKADLAQTSAELNLQRELAMTPPAGAPEVTKPPTEPAGRAPRGLAFQR